MRLLYFYLDFTKNGERPEGYRGHKRCELNFGVGEVYTLERLGGNQGYYRLNRTKREENAQIEPGFWGDERLYNISAIVGENGTGKTTLLHAITRALTALYGGPPKKLPFDFICLMQDGEGQLCLFHPQGMEIDTSDFKCRKEAPGPLRKTKLLYFSNTVSMADMEQYYGIRNSIQESYTDVLYDCSLFAGMLGAQEASTLPSQKRLLEDQLYTYFTFESYQQARYLFDRNQRMLLLQMREQGYPVPFPRELKLEIRSAIEHLKSVLKSHDEQYLMDEIKEWGYKYRQFHYNVQNKYRVIFELSLNCVANFLEMVRRNLGDEAVANATLPEIFDDPSSYIRTMRSVFSPQKHPELQNHYEACRKYIIFLWNNREHIRKYWSYQRNRKCTIALDDRLDPILQELMIRFVDLNRAISRSDYFVTYSWGLSSGESILLRIFTKLRYLLNGASYDEESAEYITAESVRKAARAERKEAIVNHTRNGEECDCDSVLLFLDEADLSLHPEWQRMFVATLAEYLPRLYQAPYYRGTNSACRDIQIIMTTHSPLMLGDFPAAAVLYLKKDKDGFVTVEQNSALQPFGQNLYTILKDGFYLQKGAVGALAQKKIKDILEDVKTVKALELSPQTDPHGVQRALDNWERRLEGHRKKTLRYLPKGILRSKLEEELAAALARLDRRRDPERRERKKQELSQEIARLQRQLYELENGGETLP